MPRALCPVLSSLACRAASFWLDVGTPSDYLRAGELLREPDERDALRPLRGGEPLPELRDPLLRGPLRAERDLLLLGDRAMIWARLQHSKQRPG